MRRIDTRLARVIQRTSSLLRRGLYAVHSLWLDPFVNERALGFRLLQGASCISRSRNV